MHNYFPAIDIHSHQMQTNAEEVRIYNLDFKDGLLHCFPQRKEGICYSLALHPWSHLQMLTDGQKHEFKACLYLKGIVAVGETGLDRLRGADWKIQTENFRFAAICAEESRKPLIVHCVRAQDELICLVKELRITVPVIIHGFNQRQDIANKWIDAGFILSFGSTLQNPESAASRTLQSKCNLPFFLETDDSHFSIGQIIQFAAIRMQKSEEEIRQLVGMNYLRIFAKWNR